jgi:hypothetical protein
MISKAMEINSMGRKLISRTVELMSGVTEINSTVRELISKAMEINSMGRKLISRTVEMNSTPTAERPSPAARRPRKAPHQGPHRIERVEQSKEPLRRFVDHVEVSPRDAWMVRFHL